MQSIEQTAVDYFNKAVHLQMGAIPSRDWKNGAGIIEGTDQNVQRMIEKLKPNICSLDGPTFYSVDTDTIWVPLIYRWDKATRYHLVLFHELVHWTGAETRLNRTSLVQYSTNGLRSQEEFVAELGSLILFESFGFADAEAQLVTLKWVALRFLEAGLAAEVCSEEQQIELMNNLIQNTIKAVQYILGENHE